MLQRVRHTINHQFRKAFGQSGSIPTKPLEHFDRFYRSWFQEWCNIPKPNPLLDCGQNLRARQRIQDAIVSGTVLASMTYLHNSRVHIQAFNGSDDINAMHRNHNVTKGSVFEVGLSSNICHRFTNGYGPLLVSCNNNSKPTTLRDNLEDMSSRCIEEIKSKHPTRLQKLLSWMNQYFGIPIITAKQNCLDFMRLRLTDDELKTIIYYLLLLFAPNDIAKIVKDNWRNIYIPRDIAQDDSQSSNSKICLPCKAQIVIYQRKGLFQEFEVIILHQNLSVIVSTNENGDIIQLLEISSLATSSCNKAFDESNIQLIMELPPGASFSTANPDKKNQPISQPATNPV